MLVQAYIMLIMAFNILSSRVTVQSVFVCAFNVSDAHFSIRVVSVCATVRQRERERTSGKAKERERGGVNRMHMGI